MEIVSDRATLHRTTGASGPRGLLVADENVALIGDYEDGGSLLLGSLGGLSPLKKSEIVMPDGRPVPPGTLVCRGSVAYFFFETDWFTFDLTQVL